MVKQIRKLWIQEWVYTSFQASKETTLARKWWPTLIIPKETKTLKLLAMKCTYYILPPLPPSFIKGQLCKSRMQLLRHHTKGATSTRNNMVFPFLRPFFFGIALLTLTSFRRLQCLQNHGSLASKAWPNKLLSQNRLTRMPQNQKTQIYCIKLAMPSLTWNNFCI